ncbi:MAG: NAD(P)-dependent oxidoreductase [Methyloligellaceae bacterium]
MSSRTRHVGVIGLGQMGGGIARNLDRAELLSGAFDAATETLQSLNISEDVDTSGLKSLAKVADQIIFVVPSSKEIRACLEGPNGLLKNGQPGTVFLDFTTSDPKDSREIANDVENSGMHYLDCGMSGGATGADAGQLTLMIGGDEAILDRCQDLVAAITHPERVFHVGPQGAGHTLKLLHNMVCHTNFMILSEACRLAEEAEIPLQKAIDVFNAGNARSLISEKRFPNHILSETWDGRSVVSNLHKDLGMGVAMSREMQRPAIFAGETLKVLKNAIASDLGDTDFTRLYLHFDELMQSRWESESEN